MRQRQYQFHTDWQIIGARQAIITAAEDPQAWSKWWPGMARARILHRTDHITGSRVAISWRSAGYTMSLEVAITDYQPFRRIEFTLSGDLVGSGTFDIRFGPDAADIAIDLRVATTKRWMNVLAPILAPLFHLNHNIIMRRGERGLNAYLLEQ